MSAEKQEPTVAEIQPLEKPPLNDRLSAGPPVAQRVLVPVANPATAEALLRLALTLIGKGGRVIAVYVMLHNVEPRRNALERITAIVEKLTAEGGSIKLVTDRATSIARGILDMAQEQSSDLIVLGIRGVQRDQVVLGPVVDAVARTALCNVLIYRGMQPLYGGEGYQHVVVPVDGSHNSKLAAQIGQRFAAYINCPMTALFVQTQPSMKRWQALGRIEASLEDLGDSADVRKLVHHADDVCTGILSRCEPDVLLVLGFSEEASLDTWLSGDIARRMLAETPGPLFLVKQTGGVTVSTKLSHRITRMMPTLTPTEATEIIHTAAEMARPTVDFSVLVILSCLIASFGLLMDSTAVVIGAMLIAPLMAPLMGFGVGLTEGDWRLMRTAVYTLIYGTILALALSFLVGLFSPLESPSLAMQLRGQPSLPDMAIALLSGMAGAYAMARKDIPAALAGVAIAAALMPPLCTTGLSLAMGQWDMVTGSFFLFATNIVSISIASALIFWWLGMRLRGEADQQGAYRQRLVVAIAVLVMMALPLASAMRQSMQHSQRNYVVRDVVEAEVAGRIMTVEFLDKNTSIIVTVQSADRLTEGQVADLEQQIAGRLQEEVSLELVVWDVVRPSGE